MLWFGCGLPTYWRHGPQCSHVEILESLGGEAQQKVMWFGLSMGEQPHVEGECFRHVGKAVAILYSGLLGLLCCHWHFWALASGIDASQLGRT